MAEAYIGEIRIFTGQKVPNGWLLCNGQSLSVSGNEALFSLIGATYGGNGTSNFNVPNLQGMLVAGYGQGTGLTAYNLGQSFGAYNVNLTPAQTAHTHALQASNVAAQSQSPVNNCYAATPTNFTSYVTYTPQTQLRQLDSKLLSAEGGNQPHSNMMPSLAFNYIICAVGLYPQSN